MNPSPSASKPGWLSRGLITTVIAAVKTDNNSIVVLVLLIMALAPAVVNIEKSCAAEFCAVSRNDVANAGVVLKALLSLALLVKTSILLFSSHVSLNRCSFASVWLRRYLAGKSFY